MEIVKARPKEGEILEVITRLMKMNKEEFKAFKADAYGTISENVNNLLDAVEKLKG